MTLSIVVVCEDNAVRLANGANQYEGRVEICIDEVWNTICADGSWTNLDANVICREAGFSATGTHTHMILKYLCGHM